MIKLANAVHLSVGALVVHRDAEISKSTIRVVVGHRPDGTCMTVFAEPAPWVRAGVHFDRPSALREVPAVVGAQETSYCRSDCAQCPLLAGCSTATSNNVAGDCFMERELRPCA